MVVVLQVLRLQEVLPPLILLRSALPVASEPQTTVPPVPTLLLLLVLVLVLVRALLSQVPQAPPAPMVNLLLQVPLEVPVHVALLRAPWEAVLPWLTLPTLVPMLTLPPPALLRVLLALPAPKATLAPLPVPLVPPLVPLVPPVPLLLVRTPWGPTPPWLTLRTVPMPTLPRVALLQVLQAPPAPKPPFLPAPLPVAPLPVARELIPPRLILPWLTMPKLWAAPTKVALNLPRVLRVPLAQKVMILWVSPGVNLLHVALALTHPRLPNALQRLKLPLPQKTPRFPRTAISGLRAGAAVAGA